MIVASWIHRRRLRDQLESYFSLPVKGELGNGRRNEKDELEEEGRKKKEGRKEGGRERKERVRG